MKKIIKISLIILLPLMILILIFNFSFGYLIKRQVKRLTNNSIVLEYKSSKTRMFIGTAEFHEAVVHFNDVSIDSSSSIFIESMSFDKFVISHLNLKDLFFNRSFNIEKVLLSGPTIHFLKDTSISRKDIFSKILTPKVVSTKSKSAPFGFQIGELEIAQGSFQLKEAEKTDFGIGRLNLKLTDIGMDDLKALNGSAPDLGANFDIQLGIYDIQKELTGGAELIIDSIVYKKDRRLFNTGGIQLKHLKSATNFASSEISLSTDLVAVEGFSLSHLLSSKDLKFTRFTISNIEIFEKLDYYDEIKISEDKPALKKQFVSNIVNAFIADTFNIQNLNYQSQNNLSESFDHINNLNLWMYSVLVDSNFILEKEFLRPVELSTVLSGPIQMHMPEKGIDVSCDTLVYLGPGKEQMITGLDFNKYPSLFSESKDQPAFQFELDSIILSGFDEREWIDSSVVELSLFVLNPQLSGVNFPLGKSTRTKSKNKSINAKKIVLNQLNIVDGSIIIGGTANEIVDIGSMSFDAVDFEIYLDETNSNKKVFWQNIFASIKNAKYQIPGKLDMAFANVTINNNDMDFDGILFSQIHHLDNYSELSKKLPDTTRLFTDRIEIDNFDIEAFVNRKYLSIDKLEITKPKYFQYSALKQKKEMHPDSISPMLFYKRINNLLPSYFSYISIKDIAVNGADVKYRMEHNNLVFKSRNTLSMLSILFDQQIPSGETPELIIDQYDFCIEDVEVVSDQLKFNSESICYNSIENDLLIINSFVENSSVEVNEANSEPMFNITLPEVQLTQPDFTPLAGGPISFDMIYLVEPEMYLCLPQQQKQHKPKKNRKSILPFTYLNEGILLENGKVTICLKNEADSTNIQVGKLNFEASELYKIIGADEHHQENKNLFQHLDFHLNDISLDGNGMTLEIDNVDYDRKVGIISINPVKQEMYSKRGAPEFRSLIEIPQIDIEHPDVMIDHERIKSYGAVNLLIPNINVSVESAKKEKSSEKKDVSIAVNDSTLRNFLGKVDFFHLDSTVLSNIGFSHRIISDTTGGSFDIERVSILVDKLKIDSSHFDFHEKRIAKDINIQLHDKELVTADSMYRMKINNITYYYSRDKIVIDSFEVIPMYERELFFEKAGFQTDRMQVKFNRAVAEGVDLLSIIESKKLQVDKLTVERLHLMDHRDQHYPRKENDFKKLPKKSLYGLPFVLNVDTVKVNNSFLLYGEYVDKSPEPGEIYFTNFDASLYNISNVSSPENRNDSLYAHITTDIMNLSPMTIDFTIPLDKEDDNFWIKADVEKVDLREFNSMTENLFGISVLRGSGSVKIPMINFNETHAEGSVIFEYKKLKLAMYNRNKAKLNRGLGSGLIDFMLNGVLIKSNNPTFLGKTRSGIVYAERNNQRSFFNFLWKGTMSGLMSTMGFNNKDQRVEKKEQKVEEKIERKDERQLNKLK